MVSKGWITIGGCWLAFVIGGVGLAADLNESDPSADIAWACIRSHSVVFEDASVRVANEQAIACMKRARVYASWLEGYR